MLHIFDNADTLIQQQADFIVTAARDAIAKRGHFSLVLSGGSSPKKLYTLLSSPAYADKIDWPKVYFFLGDERYVPLNHADSNFLMASQSLFTPLNIGGHQLFPVNTALTPPQAAQAYQRDIENFFGDKPRQFDLVLLGLGDDAHTASLFPHTTVLHEKTALVKEIYIDKVSMFRITLTAPLINQAHNISFLLFGASKAPAVHSIIEGERNLDLYPAQLIKPAHGTLHWFMDNSAAQQLKLK